jgi:DNA polymerase III subunit delta'
LSFVTLWVTKVKRMSVVLETATEHQPRPRVALSAALESGPSHAYLFRGPRGSGKRAAARAFAAEILASAAADAEDARRRALLDPSPHPDLVWLAPRGAQHLVEEVRERVIRAAAYRPFEGGSRVFVVEAAEAMRDESQNALLKTLEEPPAFVHLILLSSEPEALLETIASRCQPVDFAPLPAAVVESELAGAGTAEEVTAAARLSAGDPVRARFLLSDSGRALREAAPRLAGAVGAGSADTQRDSASAEPAPTAPWLHLLRSAEAAGEESEAATRVLLEEEAEAGMKRTARDIADESKRAGRRQRTEILDLALELCAAWLRDLAVVGSGAEEVAFNRDRLETLRQQASGLDPAAPRRGAELVQETRRSLDLNVSEELALEALFFRLETLLA